MGALVRRRIARRPIGELVDALGAHTPAPTGLSQGGVAWLTARHLFHTARLAEALVVLENARSTEHRLVLCELAAVAADRSDPISARDLLAAAGVDVDIDLDSEFDLEPPSRGSAPNSPRRSLRSPPSGRARWPVATIAARAVRGRSTSSATSATNCTRSRIVRAGCT